MPKNLAYLPALGEGSNWWKRATARSPPGPTPCRAGHPRISSAPNGRGVPVSLAVPATPRRSGRTETLTRPEHTSDNEPNRPAPGATDLPNQGGRKEPASCQTYRIRATTVTAAVTPRCRPRASWSTPGCAVSCLRTPALIALATDPVLLSVNVAPSRSQARSATSSARPANPPTAASFAFAPAGGRFGCRRDR